MTPEERKAARLGFIHAARKYGYMTEVTARKAALEHYPAPLIDVTNVISRMDGLRKLFVKVDGTECVYWLKDGSDPHFRRATVYDFENMSSEEFMILAELRKNPIKKIPDPEG